MKIIKHAVINLYASLKKVIFSLNWTAIFAVLDALFIFLYGAVSSFFWVRIQTELYSVAQYMIQDSSYLVGMLNNPLFKPFFSNIIKYVLMLVGSVYIIYVVVQGITWFFASRKIMHHKFSFWKYLGKFALFSLMYFIVIMIAIAASLRYSFATMFEHEGTASLIFIVVMGIAAYFMFISYALIVKHGIKDTFKKTFVIGIKKAHLVLIMYALLFVIGFILNFILNLAAKVSPKLMIAAGVILALPFLTLVRVYVTGEINRFDEKPHKEHKDNKEKKHRKK